MSVLATAPDHRVVETPLHDGSHRHLLAQVGGRPSTRSTVDAVIVPTARPSWYLGHAVALATRLRTPLLVLCSKYASARATADLASGRDVEVIAVDTPLLPAEFLPPFETSRLLAGTLFQRGEDLSLKRNLGLLFAAVAGWERVVFLDDDIHVPRAEDLLDAASLLDHHHAVGLSPGGFPDNSVVCHAYRTAGGLQDTFIGGGALAVNVTASAGFFPNIYNEDWFFLLSDTRLCSISMIGNAIQQSYDPFSDERRARSEEFGDCLAEGIFWLLDRGRRVKQADADFWYSFLDRRRQFIGNIVERVATLDLEGKERITAALNAALGRSRLIEPELCVDYLRAWRSDRRRWCGHIANSRRSGWHHPQKWLSELGLVGCSEYLGAPHG